MTNSVLLLTVIATNWLPLTVQSPNGDGTTSPKNVQIGILISNRFARVVADGKTNQILVSSEAQPPRLFLLREQPRESILFVTNWQGGTIKFFNTNYNL